MDPYDEIMSALSWYLSEDEDNMMSEENISEIVQQEHDVIQLIANALEDYRNK